jgi:hypothetical protein
MVNGVALSDLTAFLANPQPKNLTKILSIPGLYRMLKDRTSIDTFIPLLQWLEKRAITVLQELSVEDVPLSAGTAEARLVSDWKVVSPTGSP